VEDEVAAAEKAIGETESCSATSIASWRSSTPSARPIRA